MKLIKKAVITFTSLLPFGVLVVDERGYIHSSLSSHIRVVITEE